MESLWAFIAVLVRVFRHREGATGDQLAKVMHSSKASVSRLENNTIRLEEREAEVLDGYFGTAPLFVCLVRYAARGHDPEWFRQYAALEAVSDLIKAYGAIVIPGLVQTEEYARALIVESGGSDPEQLLRQRMGRKEVFEREESPAVVCIISQSALDWVVGGTSVHRAQLQHLLDLSEERKVGVRVLPRSAGAHAGTDGAFQLMSGPFGDVAYAEAAGAGRLVSTSSEIRRYAQRYERISLKAWDEPASCELIHRIMQEL